jgi:hypothetical protein
MVPLPSAGLPFSKTAIEVIVAELAFEFVMLKGLRAVRLNEDVVE